MVNLVDFDKDEYIDDEHCRQFGAWCLLERLVDGSWDPPVALEGDDACLKPLLEWMLAKGWLVIQAPEGDAIYASSNAGEEEWTRFQNAYETYLSDYDVYCAVDLDNDEIVFAFESYFDLDDEEWEDFLDDDRWADLRLTVAAALGLDLAEIVFMNLLEEGRLDARYPGWQGDLVNGVMWTEIERVCRERLLVEELVPGDEDAEKRGQEVLERVLAKGRVLSREMKRRHRLQSGTPDEEG